MNFSANLILLKTVLQKYNNFILLINKIAIGIFLKRSLLLILRIVCQFILTSDFIFCAFR